MKLPSKCFTSFIKVQILCTLTALLFVACVPDAPNEDILIQPVSITETAVFTVTPQPTPTVTPVPQLEVFGLLLNEGGTYTDEQLAVIASDGFVKEVERINTWWLYWAYSAEDQQPFPGGVEDATIVPFFDKDNPQSCSAAIEAYMDDQNWHTFLLPIDPINNTFREYPPVEIGIDGAPIETNYDIPVGFGPLEITGDISWIEEFGFVKTDEDGTKLTLDFKTGTWVVNENLNEQKIPYENGEALEFSPLLPAVWSKEWVGKVGDLDIPIIIGLSEGVYNDKDTPIKGVWMKQEGVDAVADAFLRASHYRYTEVMGNTATYEEYLEILKNNERGGEVILLVTDNEFDSDGKIVRREALIDPRQGFSLLITDVIPRGGVKYDRNNTSFFGVDGKGRLLLASDYFERYDLDEEFAIYGVSITNHSFISGSFSIINVFGYIENECMSKGNVDNTCGLQYPPEEIENWWQVYRDIINDMHANKQFIPLFGLD